MSRGRIVLLYGTRPEAIKLAPVAAELRALSVQVTVICTGQHSDLLDGTPAKQDLWPCCSLGLPSDGHVTEWIGNAVLPIEETLETMRPVSALVVQGDTMSAYAGALAASRLHIPVAHVEAGIRSHSETEPWPEEGIRRAIAQHAFWHYAPTQNARKNLISEGIPEQSVRITGNTVVSAISRYGRGVKSVPAEQQVFITLHRREFTDQGHQFINQVIESVYHQAEKYPDLRFLWPMHPKVLKLSGIDPRNAPENVLISPPLAYHESIGQLARSLGVATDSGGLQEEAAVLGVPCAVLRAVTDRPESVDLGIAKLFPPTPDGIGRAIRCLVTNELPRTPSDCYGSYDAAHNVARHLVTLT